MPSRYDEAKKCRVGTMDDKQFYAECDSANGAYFKSLIAEWEKRGGGLKWGAGGVGLRGPIDGKEVGVCFLAPQFGGKKDRIELACTTLAKQLREGEVNKLSTAIRAAAGDKALGNTMISVIEPGTLPVAQQGKLTRALAGLL